MNADERVDYLFKAKPGTTASDSILVPPEKTYPLRNGWLVDAFNTVTRRREQFPVPYGRMKKVVEMMPALRAKGFTDIVITNAA